MDTNGKALFLTGVPSAGKSTLAQTLAERARALSVVSGDDVIRRVNPNPSDARSVYDAFQKLLDEVEATMGLGNVVVDASLPASYIEDARRRFAGRALFVALRLAESDRRARELMRARNVPLEWNEYMTRLLGPSGLYDLNLNTSRRSPTQCADEVLSLSRARWGDDFPG